MYIRTTYRLGDGIARIMRWVMQAKIPEIRLSHFLATIWLYFLLVYQAPKVFALVVAVTAMDGSSNRTAPERNYMRATHVSFISEAVARRYGSPK